MASEFAVLIAAAGVLPESQRAVWPTKPCASVPDTPGMAAPLAVGDVDVVLGVDEGVVDGVVVAVVDGAVVDSSSVGDGVVVTVVVDGGGTASRVCGVESPPDDARIVASTAAIPNSRIVATTRTICVVPNRDFRGGADGGAGSGG
jgi:hypothetical protein